MSLCKLDNMGSNQEGDIGITIKEEINVCVSPDCKTEKFLDDVRRDDGRRVVIKEELLDGINVDDTKDGLMDDEVGADVQQLPVLYNKTESDDVTTHLVSDDCGSSYSFETTQSPANICVEHEKQQQEPSNSRKADQEETSEMSKNCCTLSGSDSSQSNQTKPHARYDCHTCAYTTHSKDLLKKHLTRHMGDRPFACEICDYRGKCKSKLTRHMLKHTGERQFACDYCDYRTGYGSALKAHILMHTGERPYACDFCDYRSKLNSHLKSHMLIHTGEKPFVCEICDYRARQHSNLKTHMKKHTGERPFACEFCDYRGHLKSHVQRHTMVHTGEKPFTCNVCGYRDKVNTRMKRHMRAHSLELPGEGIKSETNV